jgi:hypothetical protein
MLLDITIELWRIALVFASLPVVYFVAHRRGHTVDWFRKLLSNDMRMKARFLNVNLLHWAVRSVRRRGFIVTCKVAASVVIDMGLDVFYGTDTMRWVDVKALDFESEHKSNAVRY